MSSGSSGVSGSRGSGCPLHRLLEIPQTGQPARRCAVTFGGVAAFVYGVLVYAVFAGTILYAVGFVGNWFVPKSIDSGPGAPLAEALLVNGSILSLFVLQHTIMARPWFKKWWTRIVPAAIERSTFVLAASLILVLLFWQWRPLPQVIWSVEQPLLAGALVALALVGWAFFTASSFMVSHADLFGLRQVAFRLLGREYQPVGFRLRGFYRLVRHPLMVGIIVAFWSTPVMTLGHLVFSVLTTAYIFFGTWMEERDLLAEHGESYERYRRDVRGFLPVPVAAGKGGAS
ncbi:MAG: methanethiol S-methyltransferase [Phycisphaerales bacterium]